MRPDMRRWPQVIGRQRLAEGGVRLMLQLDPDLVWFAGHFPATPILPGVAQLHIALHLASQELGIGGEFSGMQMIKFQQPLRPGQQPELELVWSVQRHSLIFTYRLAGDVASSGRVGLC